MRHFPGHERCSTVTMTEMVMAHELVFGHDLGSQPSGGAQRGVTTMAFVAASRILWSSSHCFSGRCACI
jgi:hypothetical protein